MAEAKKNIKEVKKVMTIDEAIEEISKKQTELTDQKRSLVQGELVNPSIIKKTRKEIARLHTLIPNAKIASTVKQPVKEDK